MGLAEGEKSSLPVLLLTFAFNVDFLFYSIENSIRDARTPQPGEIVLDIEVVTQYKDPDTFRAVSVI